METSLAAAVQHCFASELNGCVGFAGKLAEVSGGEQVNLDSFKEYAIEISARRETLAVPYLKYAEFFNACSGPPTIKFGDTTFSAGTVVASI